jgi:hypothetical protein
VNEKSCNFLYAEPFNSLFYVARTENALFHDKKSENPTFLRVFWNLMNTPLQNKVNGESNAVKAYGG